MSARELASIAHVDDEVLQSAFRIPHDAPPNWLLVLTAYIDESNQTSDDWMSVAGFFGNDDQWKSFVPAWGEAIAPRTHLHTRMLRFSGPHAERRTKPLLERAGAVPNRCGLASMFGMVRHSDYADLVDSGDEGIFCGYIACCLPMVINTLRGIPENERIELVFERQDRHWEILDLALWTVVYFAGVQTRLANGKSKLANWRSIEKESTCLTEAADYFAYALVQNHLDPGSVRAKWCKPILNSGGGSGYGRKQDREAIRRLVGRAKELFSLGDDLPKLLNGGLMKSNPEYDDFNKAMDAILKADPAKVKAQMDAEKVEREEKRKAKKHPSASDPASSEQV